MTTRILKTVTFAVLAAWSVLALAEAPARVGRISMAQGQVTVAGELGEESNAAVVNWPVTSRNQITTGRDARTEIRVGSTAVRLDADSALDVTELDDDSLRLHLHYGSASVRVRNPDLLRGFEISTPQGIIHLQDVGRFRIDSGRRQDSTMVTVFDGTAIVDGGGSRLTVRAGKRAEIGQDDVRTGQAQRDSFDDWAMLRDERDDRSASVRYVTREMTGYEDLDQNGTWVDDREYGPLWSPRRVPVGWAPYRDGQWTYLQPWGWTWVDNAPWGYAPFHYGRWVMVNQRWCWAPGRNISRVVWSPALVGWVGGSGWSVGFNHRGTHRPAPAQGWFPLAPRDVYSPTYRMNHDNLRHVNRHSGDAVPDIRGRTGRGRHDGDNRRHGLTVVPHEQFSNRGSVPVKGTMQAIINNAVLQAAPAAVAPPTPVAMRDRNNDGRPDGRQPVRRVDLNGDGRPDNRDGDRMGRFERGAVPATPGSNGVATVPAVPAAPRPSPVLTANQPPSPAVMRREGRFGNDDLRRDSRIQNDDNRQLPRMERPSNMPTQIAPLPDSRPATVITLPSQPVAAPAPAPAAVAQPPRDDRFRGERERERQRDPDTERDRRVRGMESYQQQQQIQRPQPMQPPPAQFQQPQFQQQVQQAPRMAPPPAPVAQPMPMQMPQPQPQRMAPPPAPIAQQAPQPQRNEAAREERKRAREEAQDKR